MRRSSPIIEIVVGAIATVALNGGLAAALVLAGVIGSSIYQPFAAIIFAAPFIGLIQLIYAIPLCLYLRRRRQWNWIKGVVIGACITALLNGGCWYLLGIAGR
jgi:hypothetical protein